MAPRSNISPLEDYVSDSDSSLTVSFEDENQSREDLETLYSRDRKAVVKAFMEGMPSQYTPLVLWSRAVHEKTSQLCSDSAAKIATFNIFRTAIAEKCSGDANTQMAWFGGTKNQLSRILTVGFCGPTIAAGGTQYGHGVGVYLSPLNHPMDHFGSSTPDEGGIRYMLLCRVILGKPETITPGSTQSYPSSSAFHSGVDNQSNPRRYVIWCCNMNTHILPEFLLSFRLPPSPETRKGPSSPFITFDYLLPILGNVLDRREMAQISKFHNEFISQKLTRSQFIRKITPIAGERLLKSIIYSCYKNSIWRKIVNRHIKENQTRM